MWPPTPHICAPRSLALRFCVEVCSPDSAGPSHGPPAAQRPQHPFYSLSPMQSLNSPALTFVLEAVTPAVSALYQSPHDRRDHIHMHLLQAARRLAPRGQRRPLHPSVREAAPLWALAPRPHPSSDMIAGRRPGMASWVPAFLLLLLCRSHIVLGSTLVASWRLGFLICKRGAGEKTP